MRIIIFALLIFASSSSFALDIGQLMNEVKQKNISLSTLADLKVLSESRDRVGYGICESAGRSPCYRDGTLGYGLCEAAGRSPCYRDGSIGYGLCEIAGRSPCYRDGSIGYGLCEVAGRSPCYRD